MFRSNVSKILTGWTITTIIGLTLFWYSKKSIEARRYKEMVARRRARRQALENDEDIIQKSENNL